MTILSRLSLAAAFVVTANAVSAGTVLHWTAYNKNNLATARAERALLDIGATVAFEDFESDAYTPVPKNGGAGTWTPLTTSVGTFTTLGGATCGGSCDTPEDESLIRATSSYGRYNTTLGGSKWLDSNDNSGIVLSTAGIGLFDTISFFLTDIDDVGRNTFKIFANGTLFDIAADLFGGNRQSNGDLFLVQLKYDAPLSSSDLRLTIDSGDGFGIDDVRIGRSINSEPEPSPVPVPASLPLLLSGVVAVGWMRRRRARS